MNSRWVKRYPAATTTRRTNRILFQENHYSHSLTMRSVSAAVPVRDNLQTMLGLVPSSRSRTTEFHHKAVPTSEHSTSWATTPDWRPHRSGTPRNGGLGPPN